MIESLLIANRGEIARRILRTCRRLGIRSVAVFSEADRDAPFVREADCAVPIGAAPARESYLNIPAIIEAAQKAGAKALHPGYGFLSEKPELPAACAAAGLIFVGPPAEIVASMGSKIGAKRLAAEAGLPILPSADVATESAARQVGFPLLIKASAGGGGRGMRLVEAERDLASAIGDARREAESAFGDGQLLLERFVSRGRHIEVQIAADHHGNVVHLFERDCSVQRKNQKILEEAPAPNLSEALREKLWADAVHLARAIGYRNLGTIEFLLDVETGRHFFLEMNTRLQVEHPVTEAITGFDLVEWQLRIADGETLPKRQDEIRVQGHAIEARLTAERPEAGYLPSTGTLLEWREPRAVPGLRVDSGVERGSRITIHYDSMIAKIIAHGESRNAARQKLNVALRRLVVIGPDTNRAFLVELTEKGPFAEGIATTAMLKDFCWTRPSFEPARAADIAASAMFATRTKAPTPWQSLSGFRMLENSGRPALNRFSVTLGDRAETVDLVLNQEAGPEVTVIDGKRVFVQSGTVEYCAEVRNWVDGAESARGISGANSDKVIAAMPGLIAELAVAPGEDVVEGQKLLTLESMKLMIAYLAERPGRIAAIPVRVGQTVSVGATLVQFE